MNPLQILVIAFAGILMLTLVSNLLIEIRGLKTKVIDELDLKNVINIYKRGMLLKAEFNITYIPATNGSLSINNELIKLNNAEKTNPSLPEINCNYDLLLITNEGLTCLKY